MKKLINFELLEKLYRESLKSSRKRVNYNLHDSFNDPIQRFLNVGQPNTYVRPHKHNNLQDIELFCLITGKAAIIIYNDEGGIIDHIILDGIRNYIVEIIPSQWHNFVILQENTALLEIRRGPYKKDHKIFAPWSPKEDTKEAFEFVKKIVNQIENLIETEYF